MTSTLARLARAGMIVIRDDPADGRAKLVSLTDAGRAARETALVAVGQMLPMMADILSDAEIAAMLPALRRLRIALDALREPPAGARPAGGGNPGG